MARALGTSEIKSTIFFIQRISLNNWQIRTPHASGLMKQKRASDTAKWTKKILISKKGVISSQ
jgi:hypothetical protein